VLEAARRNHPHVLERGEWTRSGTYARAIPGPAPLPPPAVEPTELRFTYGDLAGLRDFVARTAEHEGVDQERIGDLVLAVDELATNSLRYARGGGVLRTWRENGALLVEVADDGHIADPLAGRDCPGASEMSGRGLYLVNQVCDLVQLRSSPDGSVVRVHMHLD
jgi:anti-sigma regulatory factor (Ser/Thr protein kinase)